MNLNSDQGNIYIYLFYNYSYSSILSHRKAIARWLPTSYKNGLTATHEFKIIKVNTFAVHAGGHVANGPHVVVVYLGVKSLISSAQIL
jgi:hypothetical protein